MGLREILEKLRHRKEYYNDLKMQDKATSKLEQSKLSSEERALNKILEKKRQEAIKEELKKHYKEEDDDYWHKDIISQKNIFNGKEKLFKHDQSLLHQKNIFTKQKRLFVK